MDVPHTFLIASGVLWIASLWAVPEPDRPPAENPPALGVAGSAYGSLVARVMRDSLSDYWHDGEGTDEHGGDHGSLHGHDDHDDYDDHDDHDHGDESDDGDEGHEEAASFDRGAKYSSNRSLITRATELVKSLESSRTRRNSPFAISSVHRQYLHASAAWRLRLAYAFDPGDFILYEILHVLVEANAPETHPGEMTATEALAERAIERAQSPQAGFSDVLTGAGAAINLLNEAERSPSVPGDRAPGSKVRNWSILVQCLRRYETLRDTAVSEGWWLGIPANRREDLDSHARLLARIAASMQEKLTSDGVLREGSR